MHPILILWLKSGAEGSPSKKVMVSNYTAARPVRSPSVSCTLVLCVGGSWSETTEPEKKIFDQFHLRLQTTTQLGFSLNLPRTSGNLRRRDPHFECVLCKFVEDGDRDEFEVEWENCLIVFYSVAWCWWQWRWQCWWWWRRWQELCNHLFCSSTLLSKCLALHHRLSDNWLLATRSLVVATLGRLQCNVPMQQHSMQCSNATERTNYQISPPTAGEYT